jgi:hypothetical protein
VSPVSRWPELAVETQGKSKPDKSISNQFPGVGHRYLVDFKAFRVQLYFTSLTSLTYTGVNPDGSLGGSETVTIKVETIGDQLNGNTR